MNLRGLLLLLCLIAFCCYGKAQNISGNGENSNVADVLGSFVRTMHPGKYVNGMLCWKTSKITSLSINLNKYGVVFQNFAESKLQVLKDLVLIDMKCKNGLEKEKERALRNVLLLNVNSCEDIPNWSLAPLVNIYIFPSRENKVIKCRKAGQHIVWMSQIIGAWNDQEGFVPNALSKKASVVNEETHPIEVAYVFSQESRNILKDIRRDLLRETASRFNYQLLNELFMFLNLTVAESFASHVEFLDKISPTSKEVIGYPFVVSKENFTIYDFLSTRTPNFQSFLMRAPSLSAVSNVYTLPLELNVWYASYSLVVIIVAAIFAIVKVEWKFPDMITNKYRIMYPRMMDVVHMHVGAIAQQGSEAEPTSGGGRIATFLVFLFFLFLYTAYSANIVALLGSTTTRVHGVTDLKDFSVKLGIDKKDYTRYMFQNQDSREHRALFGEKLAKDECYMSLDEGIDRVRSEFFAFHGRSDKIYKMIDKRYADNEKCGFVEIPYLAETAPLVPIRKDSTHKEMLKIGLALFLERGMHNRIKSIMFAKQPRCYSGGTHFVSVSLLDCYFAFVIYGGGAAMSFVIFVLETLAHRTKITQILKSERNVDGVDLDEGIEEPTVGEEEAEKYDTNNKH